MATSRGRRRGVRIDDPVAFASLSVVVGLFVAMAWRSRWTHDDGFITFRVVDNVFAGHGPVYNPGQRVEAFTSPLHVALLVVLRALLGWAIDQAWLSALLTLGAATGGLVAAADGAKALARASGAKGRLLPFAVVVPAVLPPMWEYATAGLETGLAIGWVGASFCVLARLAARQRRIAHRPPDARPLVAERRILSIAVLVGLGPLVRPECTLLTIGFVAALCTFAASASVPRWRILVAALALPVAYQLFRMGWYGALLPNTALAKAAGSGRWRQGWYYLSNTVAPYALVVPFGTMVAWLASARRRGFDRVFGGTDGRTLVVATMLGAVAYLAYVVRVGGDYMHARMVLVPIFALCCPLAVVAVPRAASRRKVVVTSSVVLGGWALLTLLALRAPAPEGFFGGHSIAEQRTFYAQLAGNDHPVTLDEWRASPTYAIGDEARQAAAAHSDVLFTAVSSGDVQWPRTTPVAPGEGVSLFVDGIGVAGARAGLDVHVIDLHGLAHPLASRMAITRPRQLPGHERALPLPWALAEAGAQGSDPRSDVFLARLAMRCPPVSDVLGAVEGPVGLGGFLRNLLDAPRLTFVDIPKDPSQVVDTCGNVPGGSGVGGS